MDLPNLNQLLSEPLIPAIAILLILVFVFIAYKIQIYRQKQKPMSQIQIPIIDENIKKRRQQQVQPAPLIVPSSNKAQGVTETKPKSTLESGELDDDPQEKPLFPSKVSLPHETEKSCDDLYKELLDPDVFEEALYNELLEGKVLEDKDQTASAPSAEERMSSDIDSELLLTEIEKEFLDLEKDLHRDEASLDENPYSQNYDTASPFNDNDDPNTIANSLPPEDLSVKDLQLEMEETIAKLSKQVEDQDFLENIFNVEEIPEKTVPTVSPIPEKIKAVKSAHSEPENPVSLAPKSPSHQKPVATDSSQNEQYINRLKSFQSNLEQRFGSFDIANDPIRSKITNDDSLVDKIAYSANNEKSANKSNSLELLESFLFTANQINRK